MIDEPWCKQRVAGGLSSGEGLIYAVRDPIIETVAQREGKRVVSYVLQTTDPSVRPHLSVNGRRDSLTPPAGVEKILDRLMPLYQKYGNESDCRIELFDCAHVELPEMRKEILEWMERI